MGITSERVDSAVESSFSDPDDQFSRKAQDSFFPSPRDDLQLATKHSDPNYGVKTASITFQSIDRVACLPELVFLQAVTTIEKDLVVLFNSSSCNNFCFRFLCVFIVTAL